MATLTIRQLDDDVYDRLKLVARRNHRSIEAEVRHVIEERLRATGEEAGSRPSFEDRVKAVTAFLESVEHLHARSRPNSGLPDSTQMIREMRDEG